MFCEKAGWKSHFPSAASLKKHPSLCLLSGSTSGRENRQVNLGLCSRKEASKMLQPAQANLLYCKRESKSWVGTGRGPGRVRVWSAIFSKGTRCRDLGSSNFDKTVLLLRGDGVDTLGEGKSLGEDHFSATSAAYSICWFHLLALRPQPSLWGLRLRAS